MAVSVFDEEFLTEEQKRQLQAFTDAWNRANAAGDAAGMASAHAAAEEVRAQAGYSGGDDGGQFVKKELGTAYEPAKMPSYKAQTDEVNRAYDAARDAQIAGLRSAFEENSAALEARMEAAPQVYDAMKNAAAASSELAGRNFREYASASGLSSGAGGQAELARANALQGDMAAIDRQEASERKELQDSMDALRVKYQNDIAAAVADGEYRRAAALLDEYRREQESAVSVAGAQADENYRAWQAGLKRDEVDYGRARDAAEDELRRESLEYERARDAASDRAKRESLEYERSRDAASDARELYRRELEMAELLAKYGDYSGLRALGVDTSAYETAAGESSRRGA